MADWLIEPRSPSLVRGSDPVTLPAKLSVATPYNTPGTALVTATTGSLAALLQPGWGAVITRDGNLRFSGLVTELGDQEDGQPTVTLTSDLVRLWDRQCYPTPSADLAAQTSDYDVRTGTAEDVALAFINANAGPGAIPARRTTGLVLPTSQGRGPTITVTARYDNLGRLVADIMEAAGLRIDVVHDESTGTPRLLVVITSVADLSSTVRFGSAEAGGPGILSGWKYTLSAPKSTIEIVAGGGTGAGRIIRGTAHDTAAEALWGRRIENFVDQRQTTDNTELDKAGADQLAQDVGPTSASGNIVDTPGLGYGTDWDVGDKVGRSFGALQLPDIVREVTVVVERNGSQQDELVSAVIGSSDASKSGATQKQLAKALRRIAGLEQRQ